MQLVEQKKFFSVVITNYESWLSSVFFGGNKIDF